MTIFLLHTVPLNQALSCLPLLSKVPLQEMVLVPFASDGGIELRYAVEEIMQCFSNCERREFLLLHAMHHPLISIRNVFSAPSAIETIPVWLNRNYLPLPWSI